MTTWKPAGQRERPRRWVLNSRDYHGKVLRIRPVETLRNLEVGSVAWMASGKTMNPVERADQLDYRRFEPKCRCIGEPDLSCNPAGSRILGELIQLEESGREREIARPVV